MQTPITPVAVYPSTANTLYIRSIALGTPPQFYYELQNVVVVPPVAEQLDPTTGAVLIAAAPEQTIVTVLKNGNVSMTEDQWDNWAAGPITEDEPYQLDCIATNLGLTRA
mgnify:FL=1|jgi:hypothetical protein